MKTEATIWNVKYHVEKLGILFWSNDIDLTRLRIMDLFYIAYLELYPDSEVPDNKTISKLLRISGKTKVQIIYDSIHHCYKAIF